MWTRGPYSHTELVFSGGLEQESECYSSSYTDGGIRRKYITLTSNKWDYIELQISDELFNSAKAWMELNIGKSYDVLGLVGFIIGPIPDSRDKYFCSEAVGCALGVKQSWRLNPNTLYTIVSSKLLSGI